MTTGEQRAKALAKGQARRLMIARLREQVRAHEITLQELMSDPPEILSNYTLADVLRFPRTHGRYTASPAVTTLGRQAIGDHVNLLVSLGDASARSRAWVAEYGTRSLQCLGLGHNAR